jgi:hypothetical protein
MELQSSDFVRDWYRKEKRQEPALNHADVKP